MKSEKACKICQSVLDTLTGFVDWVNITHITESDLLPLLCALLLDKHLCLRASECLLLIVGRKVGCHFSNSQKVVFLISFINFFGVSFDVVIMFHHEIKSR